ncbi:MAG: hypothetical protein RQ966_03210 [Acetobacteraceae bacterium]|nr:hypothetical protein [Acetobacteraceae bacterium]
MFKRATVFALNIALIGPGHAWAQATPERAAAIQQQIQDWLQSAVGTAAAPSRSPVHVTASGDHYDLSVAWGSPESPPVTGKLTEAGNGQWAVDDVRIPSPSVIKLELPPGKPKGSPPERITSTVTAGEQNQRLLYDPTFAAPSTWTAKFANLDVATTGPNLNQLSHIDNFVSASTMTPAGDDRVNVTTSATLDGYHLKMSDGHAAQPTLVNIGAGSLVSNAFGLSRNRGFELVRMVSDLAARAQPTAGGAASPPPKPDPETTKALVTSLTALLTGMSLEEKVSDLSVTSQGLTGSLKVFSLRFASKANAGRLESQFLLSAEGLSLPDLGLGDTAKLIPTKITIGPSFSGASTEAIVRLAQEYAAGRDPNDRDLDALFSKGPITVGLDDLQIDVAGSSIGGHLSVEASSPNTFIGSGRLTATNIDSLQRALASDPQTAQAAPFLIFLKGVSRPDQDRLVWDLSYRDGHFLVNDQDMMALLGAGAAAPPGPAPKPRRPGRQP